MWWIASPAILSPSLLIPVLPSTQNNHDPKLSSVVLYSCVVPIHRIFFIYFGCCFSLPPFLILHLLLELSPAPAFRERLGVAECTCTLSAALLTLSHTPVAGSERCPVLGLIPADVCFRACLSVFKCWTFLVPQWLNHSFTRDCRTKMCSTHHFFFLIYWSIFISTCFWCPSFTAPIGKRQGLHVMFQLPCLS